GQQIAWLAVEPTITILLAWTNPWHGLMWRGYALDSRGPLTVLVPNYGPWLWVNVAYSYLLIAVGTYQFIVGLWRSSTPYRAQIAFILAGAFVPWIANILFLFNLGPVPNVDFTPFAFTFTGIVIAVGLFRFQLLDLVPIARDMIVEAMNDGVIVLDTQNRIVDLNPAAGRVIGRRASEAVGQPAFELLHISPDLVEHCDDAAGAQEEIVVGEGEAQCCYDLRIMPLHDRRKNRVGCLITLHDITARRKAEHALQEREARLRVTMEQTPAILWTTDTRLRFTSSVGAGLAALNLGPDQVVGLTLSEYFQMEDPDFPPIAAHRRALMGESVTYEQEWAGNLYQSHVEPLRDAEGHIVGCVGLALDITARRQAEEALRRRDAILEAVSFAAEQLLKSTAWDQRIQDVLERLGEATGVSRVYIFENHVDRDGTLLTSQRYEWAAPGIEPQIDNPDLQNFPWRAGGFGRWEETFLRGELIFGHVREFPASEQEVLAPQEILSILAVPIFVEGTLWGFIGFDECRMEREWTAVEREALRTAAGILGAAIQRSRAEDTLRRRAEELHTLHAISLDISAPNDLPTLLHTIVERAAQLLDASGGGLYLCDPERQEARCVVSYNTRRDYTGTVLKYGEGSAGLVAQTGEPLIIDDYRTWPGRAAVYEEEQPFTSVLSAPMIWQGQVTGVIHVLHDVEVRRFTQADLELLSLFASQAAIAVENARLLEAEREQRRAAETRAAELREREHYLALLNDITLAAIETSDFQTMLQTLADRLGELIDADGCYITLWDEARQMTIPAAAYGELRETYRSVPSEPGEVTMTESVLRAGHPLVSSATRGWPARKTDSVIVTSPGSEGTE
ncbi:MAG: GAF domain-containing protein, partial [Chloroflexi bacterium]